MKKFRKLQLRQGQELSRAEQQHVMGGEWIRTGTVYGHCACLIPKQHAHINTIYGYSNGSLLGTLAYMGSGALTGFGAGSYFGPYGACAGAILGAFSGYCMSGGREEVNYREVCTLVSISRGGIKTHNNAPWERI